MDLMDNELKKELSNGPLAQNGFSAHLKRRIEEQIDRREKQPKRRSALLGGISLAIVAAAAIGLWGDWQRELPFHLPDAAEEAGATAAPPSPAPAVTEAATPARSALLLGLRTDHASANQGKAYSAYRTVLVAPERGKLYIAADGPGILMPYKMNFWKIDTVELSDRNQRYRVLNAFMASSNPGFAYNEKKPGVALARSEKLLFAGNKYLSIAQQVQLPQNENKASGEYVWVKELEQLANPSRQAYSDPLREPHVTMQDLFGSAATGKLRSFPADSVSGESWAIVRKPGKWVPQLAAYVSKSPDGSSGYTLRDVSLDLPESVVSYDQLTADWDDIKQKSPDAIDAFSSPNHDIVAVVTKQTISIYPYHDQKTLAQAPLMKLELSPNESVVMAQWASEPYIDQWKQKAALYLQNE